MLRLARLFPLFPLVAILLAASSSFAASWETGNYGGNLTMTYYVPDNAPEHPALVLSLHYCGGQAVNAQGWFKSFADMYGFMIIAPKAPGECWDASPGRSGDRAQLAMMIDWALQNHAVDPTRVFSAGASSGACMSETMLASYPDKIAAAAVLAGVPVGFWAGGNSCGVCSMQVASAQTPQAWGDKVRAAGPMNYTGSRGRIQLFHAIQDQYLGSGNFAVEVSQWSDALGVTGQGEEEQNAPRNGWTRTSYENAAGDVVVQANWWGNSPANSHDLTSNINPALWVDVVEFFGLDKPAAPEPMPSADPSSTATGAIPTATASASAPMSSVSPTETPSASAPMTSAVPTAVPTELPSAEASTSAAPEGSTAPSATLPAATSSTPPSASTPATPSAAASASGGVTPAPSSSQGPGAVLTDGAGDDACACELPGARRTANPAALAGLGLAIGLVAALRRRRAA